MKRAVLICCGVLMTGAAFGQSSGLSGTGPRTAPAIPPAEAPRMPAPRLVRDSPSPEEMARERRRKAAEQRAMKGICSGC